MSFVRVSSLSQTIFKKQILKDIHFESDLETVVALLGPNGAGKTTFLRTLAGLLPAPKSEEGGKRNGIFLAGECINSWSVAKRVEHGLLYLPQQPSLFGRLSTLENLRLVYEYHAYWHNRRMKDSDAVAREAFNAEMHKWLQKTHLTNVLNHKAQHLSGGQKRKLEIVRALLMHPKVIMLDEPFAGVDPKSIYELKEIFKTLAQGGMLVVISDHNVDQLLSIAERIYVIVGGEVVVAGGIKEVMNNQFTKEMYLGNQFHVEMSERYLAR
jgi:lipopolysaccharide export system ATP-binding protein